MALSFVASATTTSTAASTMVVTLPTHSEGDYIVLAFVHDYTSNTQQLSSVNNSFTELAEISESGLAHQAAIWVKKAGASETNPTATYNSSTQEMACLAFSFSGVDGTTQVDAGPSSWVSEDPSADDTISSPSITTVTDNAFMVSVASADENDTFTEPSGMTLVDSLDFSNMAIAAAYEDIATAGATGTRDWTFAQSGDELTAVSFAIRPAATGGVTVSPSGIQTTDYQFTPIQAINLKGGLQ